MAERDVVFDVEARDKTGPALKTTADGLDRVGDKADQAQRKVDELGDETGQLARQMLEAKAAAAALARELDKTGDTKLLKDLDRAQRDVNKLARAIKQLGQDDDTSGKRKTGFSLLFGDLVEKAKKAGILAGEATIDGFGSAMKALPSEVKAVALAAAIGAAAVMVPVLVGAVESALLVGAGGGVLTLGIIAAVKDPAVASAFSTMADNLGAFLRGAVKPLGSELVATAKIFQDAILVNQGAIKRMFAGVATEIQPLAKGVGGLFTNLMPGLEAAVKASLPLIRELATWLPQLGTTLSTLFQHAAEGGPGAQMVFRGLLELVKMTLISLDLLVVSVGRFLNLVASGAEWLGIWKPVKTDVEGTARAMTQAGQAATTAAQAGDAIVYSYEQARLSLQNTAQAADNLNQAFDRLFNEQMNLDRANLAVKQGQLALTEAIKQNGKTLDDNTAKGQANTQAIQTQIGNLNAKRQADIAAGNGTVEATKKANGAYLAQLEGLRQLLYSLGLNKAEVDRLINKYAELAKPQTKTFTTVYRTEGRPPAGSDQSTGHSRTGANDLSGMTSWAPARFAARDGHSEFAGGTSRTGGPARVSVEAETNVYLDSRPLQAYTTTTVREAQARDDWRRRVGTR